MAKVTILGHLGADCTVRELSEGRSVINFSIAENIKKKDRTTGESVTFSQWFNCSFFTKNSARIADYLKKGAFFAVFGDLEFEEFKSDKSSEVKRSNNVLVSDLKILATTSVNESSSPTANSQEDDLLF